ncbi:MAG: extracellular solute-binding protein [[Ruminococcus] torques]
MNSGKINDKMAGLVLSSSVLAVGYNPTVLEKAGVEAPTSDWTWKDYIELNQKAAETTGKESALIAAGVTGDTNVFNYWVRQHGGQLFNEDQTSLGYDDDSITADYFAMWKDMMDKNIAPDPDEFAQIKTLGDEASPVVKDEAATMIEWNNYTAKMSNVNDKLKLATPPLGDNADDKGLWIKPGMFFSVSENSKVKKECAEFIDWFINSEEANDIIMAERGTPVSSDIRQYMVDSGKLSPQQVDMFNYIDEAEKLSGTTPAPDPSGIAEVNEAFNNAGNTVFYGQATPEEAAKTFRVDVEEILARNSQ